MTTIYITCKNKEEAQKIGLYLVKKRLAACCNIIPTIQSFYWWLSSASAFTEAVSFAEVASATKAESTDKKASEGKKNKVGKDSEAILILHTIKKNFKKIEGEVKKHHSYKVPCIMEIMPIRVNKKYLSWLKKELG